MLSGETKFTHNSPLLLYCLCTWHCWKGLF